MAGLAGVTVLAIGIELVGAGRLDPVFLALLPLAAVASFEVVGPLAQAVALQDANEAAAERLFELADAPPAVVDPPADAPARPARTDLGISVSDVRFRYGPDEPEVLAGCSFEVPGGTSLAIVGPSGSGKTTLVNLLLRFWEVDAGEIRIGGRDIRDDPADDVRRLLGVVSQDVHLFNATIRDNLALADEDVTDERIEAACRQARIHDAIVALPAGYETRVGENGVLLSGGERQRLAIARAIITRCPDPGPRRGHGQPRRRHGARGDGRAGAVHRRPDDAADHPSRERRGRDGPDGPARGGRIVDGATRPPLTRLPGVDQAANAAATTRLRLLDDPGRGAPRRGSSRRRPCRRARCPTVEPRTSRGR